MARHKDSYWDFPAKPTQWDQVQAALLMDLRDELKQLNRVFACPNAQEIPSLLRQIEQNTRRKKRRRVKVSS